MRKVPRVAERVSARRPRAPRVDDLKSRLLETATLLSGSSPDSRVSLLLLLNMRMSGYFRRNQRSGSE